MRPGARFSHYEILSRLALGGLAEVWLAVTHGAAGFRKHVAIKTVLPELAGSARIVDMFVREASILAELNHPNIVQVFDFGEIERRYFMAMEYVPGPTLRDVLGGARDLRQLPPLWFVLRVLAPVCDALHYLHQCGILHHDLSPENIMVSSAGGAKLIDFGAADSTGTQARDGSIVGKCRYVAPERIENLQPDARSDVYSLGVILYEMATGVKPFDGDDPRVLLDVLRGSPPDPREHNPALSDQMTAIILRALARDPAERQPHVRALRADLLHVLHASPIEAEDLGGYVNALFPQAEATPPEIDIIEIEAVPPDEQVVIPGEILALAPTAAVATTRRI